MQVDNKEKLEQELKMREKQQQENKRDYEEDINTLKIKDKYVDFNIIKLMKSGEGNPILNFSLNVNKCVIRQLFLRLIFTVFSPTGLQKRVYCYCYYYCYRYCHCFPKIKGFGEIALRSDKSRTATIVCKTECRMAVLSKQNFKKILDQFLNLQIREKIDFLKSVALFDQVPFRQYKNILPLLKKRTFN